MYCLSSFCCVCLNDGVKLQDINQLDIDGLPLINKIIFVSFGHEAIDFKVVRYICFECTNILQLAYKFKRSCLVNHELLRIYSGQLKYFTGKVSEYRDLIVSLEKLPENDDKTEVNSATVDKNEENSATNDTSPSHNPPPRKTKKKKQVTLKCSACDATFNRYVLLQMHYTTKHKSFFKVIKKKFSSDKKSSLSYTCNICSNKLATLFSLTRHLQLHTRTQTQCKFCPQLLENNESYKKHLMTVHADRAALRCDICNKTLENDFYFRRHMFFKHSPQKCKHCDEIFFSNSELWAHIAENHRVHKCDFCERAFSHLKNLRTHMKIHETGTAELLEIEPEITIQEPEIIIQELEPIPETKAEQNVLNSRFRKKCTNCLSVFSSGISLKKHKCFKLKNMFQCSNCYIIYSKKSSFTNHVRNCVFSSHLPENIANTPELDQAEQSKQSEATEIIPENNVTETPGTNVIKDENDLEIKEEILDDFICNQNQQKENSIEIGEVYSISELSEIDNNQEEFAAKTDDAPTKSNEQRQTKKTFPKIRLVGRNPPKNYCEKDAELISALKLRWTNIFVPVNELNETSEDVATAAVNQQNSAKNTPEISSASDKLKTVNLRRKSGTFDAETTETIFADTEFSDSNDSVARHNIIDPLLGFDAAKSNSVSRSASVSCDEFSHLSRIEGDEMENDEAEKDLVAKRRKTIWNEDVLNESFCVDEFTKTENIDTSGSSNIGTSSNFGISSNIAKESSNFGISSNLRTSSNFETVSSNVGIESSNIRTETSNNRPESSNLETSSNLGTSSNFGTSSNLGTSSNFGTVSSNIGTSSNFGTESSNIGTSSNFGTESSNIGTESSNIRLETSNNRPESSNLATSSNLETSSNFGTVSSNNVIESSNIRTETSINKPEILSIEAESSNVETKSSNTGTASSITEMIEPEKQVVKRRRISIWREDTSNENSNESLFDKIDQPDKTDKPDNPEKSEPKKGSVKKRRKSIWIDDMIELNENFNIEDVTNSTNAENITVASSNTGIEEPKKNAVKRRRKSHVAEDTSNENSNESLFDKTDTSEKVGPKKGGVKTRRQSIWSENGSNENSSDSFVDKTNHLEQTETETEKERAVKRRRKSISIESNEESTDSTSSTTIKKSARPRRKSVFIENPTNIETLCENVESSSEKEIKSRRKSVSIEVIPDLHYFSTENKNTEAEAVLKDSSNGENKNKNLEPIILKTRRLMKSRRKTKSALNAKTEIQGNASKPSDVNENLSNVANITNPNPTNLSNPLDFLATTTSSSIKSVLLRRKSVCDDVQAPKIDHDLPKENQNQNDNENSYITVRKISDINNDISGQRN